MKTLTQEQLVTDLDYFYNKLVEMHPNPFKYIKRGEFLSDIEEIKTIPGDIRTEEFGIRLMKLLARLNDGHTEIGASDDVLGTLNYPFKFKYITDGYYVIGASKEYEKYLGFKLLGINDKSISGIEDILGVIIPTENETSMKYYLPTKLVEPKILNYFGITNGNYAKFIFQKGRKNSVAEVLALDYNTELIDIFSTVKNLDKTLQKKETYWVESMTKLNAVYLQYNECEEKKGYTVSQVVRDIKASNMRNLIIDLRNNKGGDSDVLNPILSYIKSEQKRIRVFVLVGTDTYSSAVYNLIQLSKLKNVVSIGDIPHGNPTHYGQVRSFELPNSKIKVFISTRTFTFKGYGLGEPFKPTHKVSQIMDELLVGRDTQFRYLEENLL